MMKRSPRSACRWRSWCCWPRPALPVPHDVYERLNDKFVLEERGEIDVKGKGMMTTWYLVSRRDEEAVRNAVEQGAPAGST